MWAFPKTMSIGDLRYCLLKVVGASRFTAEIDEDMNRNRCGLKIHTVRLRRAKDYCGQHPGECQVNFFFSQKHRRTKFLEGLDWMGFNAMLNDYCDKTSIDCDVFSYNREALNVVTGKYFIRRGTLRRVRYPYETKPGAFRVFSFWTQTRESLNTDFADYCGKAPPELHHTDADAGTPGYACYTTEDENRLRSEEEHGRDH